MPPHHTPRTGAPPSDRRAAPPTPSVTRRRITELDPRALYFVSYDGLVNNNSFQQNGLFTHRGHQYAAWWTATRHAVVARRALGADRADRAGGTGGAGGSGGWSTITLAHRLKSDDSHNVISLGHSPLDGRLHLVMDAHSDGYFYVKSAAGLLDDPAGTAWTPDVLGPVRSTLDGLALTTRFTYPQFLPTPEGRLQLGYRTGESGDGRNALAEYDGSAWTELGEWTGSTGTYTTAHGSSTARNMYLHGIGYGGDGLLHAFFTWRERDPAVLRHPGGLTNHDTGYVRSADRGRTWHTDAGTLVAITGTPDTVTVTDPGLVVDPLGPDHALMNQESQAVDSAGLPHAIISHVPERHGPCTGPYAADRAARARAHHLRKDADGRWHKTELPFALHSSQRTALVLDRYDNAYAILPRGRIAAASRSSGHTDWTLLDDGGGLNAFGEVVIDRTRVAEDHTLSFLYQEASSGTTPSALHVADYALPA
ncbi:BNR repeat-containing protein [Streptomyces mangrovisoli]|uniref:Tat pathway signal sequence domain protein n=1 Tax=Streptomyces mangrovisoli TaxID=1428628 RepID=A0A1J4P623_9ACTN|nr:BNR repeat-containing protein [Streptomyces mangrovisoli]OIJ68957.1 Tat pathway signal sequence domain protein [Streptomyces mangrovisoli]